jgi:hypothetical protein
MIIPRLLQKKLRLALAPHARRDRRQQLQICALLLWLLLSRNAGLLCWAESSRTRPLLMAHYMPWYEAPPTSQRWGWHWTMDHYHAASLVNGRRAAASHYYPLIGLYDSSDPDALECQVLLLKLSGIDGVIIDWYGKDNYLDYAVNHRNTQHLIDFICKAGLRFAIMYEDQTVPKLIAGSVIPQKDALGHGRDLMQWLQQNWFASPNYLKLGNRPLFMVFGPQYYKDGDWQQLLATLSPPPVFFTLQRPCGPAAGAFGWPSPTDGSQQSVKRLDDYYAQAKHWQINIPAAYPRFHDIYSDAGVHPSWGTIEDREGKTYKETLERALNSQQPVVQLVTWNDWGEGTQIEPSVEFGYRDLEITQAMCRQYVDPSFPYGKDDLRLPIRLYNLKRQFRDNAAVQSKLKTASWLLFKGNVKEARKLLDTLPT